MDTLPPWVYKNSTQLYSIIPLKPNSKEPLIKWKQYQTKTPLLDDITTWLNRYKDINLGLITGRVNEVVVVDIDNKNDLEVLNYEENLGDTTTVITNRGIHLYYTTDNLPPNIKIKTQYLNLSGYNLEIKGEGSYVVSPPSIIENFTRYFYTGWEYLKPLPDRILNLLKTSTTYTPYKVYPGYPEYKGRASCIEQILNRDLIKGERQNSLFILGSLLYRAYNTRETIKDILYIKNSRLKEPLENNSIKGIIDNLGKYNPGCAGVKRGLPYPPNCDVCMFKKGENEMIRKEFLERLNITERGILLSFNKGFKPEEIAKDTGLTRGRVYQLIKKIEDIQNEEFNYTRDKYDDNSL